MELQLPDRQSNALASLSSRTGRSANDLVVEAVDRARKAGDSVSAGFTLSSGGTTDVTTSSGFLAGAVTA